MSYTDSTKASGAADVLMDTLAAHIDSAAAMWPGLVSAGVVHDTVRSIPALCSTAQTNLTTARFCVQLRKATAYSASESLLSALHLLCAARLR